MAAKTTLKAKNLEALGAPRLAELLLEISAGDAAAKRRLRLALAGSQGPAEVAREVRKRLALDRAAALVSTRAANVDGNHYEILGPAAKALADRHPLAATLLLRAMIDFSLEASRTSRYRHAARHLGECARLAASTDFAGFDTHEAYLAGLRESHGRKRSFWELVD